MLLSSVFLSLTNITTGSRNFSFLATCTRLFLIITIMFKNIVEKDNKPSRDVVIDGCVKARESETDYWGHKRMERKEEMQE